MAGERDVQEAGKMADSMAYVMVCMKGSQTVNGKGNWWVALTELMWAVCLATASVD